MLIIFGPIFVVALALGISAMVRESRPGGALHVPSAPSSGPPPPTTLPPSAQPPQVWAEAGLGPVKPDTAGSNAHVLTAADVVVPPVAFAIAAGYPDIESMVDGNPHLQLVDPPTEGWPPLTTFSYIIKGTADIYTFSPTGRLDASYLLPTYKSGDAEWIFPTWGLASARPDVKTDVLVYEGHFPIVSSKSTPTIFASALATPPYVQHRGLMPWVVGTVVTVNQV